MACLELRLREALLALAATGALAGCVDSFDGANLQIDFSTAVEVPSGNVGDPVGTSGTVGEGKHVHGDTYFTFYGTKEVRDADGHVTRNDTFEVTTLEIVPVINVSSPCFIELEDAAFPGLHVTQYAGKVRETICDRLNNDAPDCFTDPFSPPTGATDGDVQDIIGAAVRMSHLPMLQDQVESVVSFSNFQYPEALTDCNFSGDQIPAPTCTDDASNAQRLRVCNAIWAEHPEKYEGSDKVFTLPLNGTFRGMVEGNNPVNGGPIGGATIFVDTASSDFDSFSVNWQFKDHDGDGEPDYPADWLTDHDPSDVGYIFLTGRPESRTRGVISSHMVNPFDSNISAEVALFADIGEDDVSF